MAFTGQKISHFLSKAIHNWMSIKKCSRNLSSHPCWKPLPDKNLNFKETLILGIESSCDDTAAAIIDGNGQILAHVLKSQTEYSVRFGGVIPVLTKKIHISNIGKCLNEVFTEAGVKLSDITAVAATTHPGNGSCLEVGLSFGRNFCLKTNKPFIPIHHMEAHALTARMIEKIDFPFLVLLVSGGHCLLALVQDIDKYILLASTVDKAPGDSFDKVARLCKLRDIPELSSFSGGKAVEVFAEGGNAKRYPSTTGFPGPMFSFTGYENVAREAVYHLLKVKDTSSATFTQTCKDICASFQYNVASGIQRKTDLVMSYLQHNEMLPPENRVLVVSGGVASNKVIRKALEAQCEFREYRLVAPPIELCTDNGIMIAWNGLERWKAQKGIITTPEELNKVKTLNKSELGPNIYKKITNSYTKGIKVKF